ncbi:carbohydrate ABC transporter permease [Tenggerimyces flavus]|uniref:Carbohydrate ABC transporter permease n=1 Tax=Tenggerimyces flavus TaxID=1708749 RepID=A0ABV7Y7G7_9ACTN|nr:carbohydrate ABC transporter permease [Tenggerimyces flavus]MBM7785436.1 multiple sugar transport system permease protein [Tenggerimyces flavus]
MNGPPSRAVAVGRHVILIAVSLLFVLPFYWMLTSALKDDTQILSSPITWWPDPIRWENIPQVLNYPGFPFLRMLWNSVFYSGMVTIGTVISSSLVAYGFAKLRFPGRNVLFIATVATLMIPPLIIFIPTYVLFKVMGLIGSYAPLIIPQFLGSAFFIFLLRQFFMTIPNELSDAARVDGAGEFRIFWQIMLPLVKPALAVVAVFTWLGTWHDFFGPLIYLTEPDSYPLSLGLFAFQAQRTTEWALMMGASALVTLPLIVLFAFTQRYFLRGIALTGIKG